MYLGLNVGFSVGSILELHARQRATMNSADSGQMTDAIPSEGTVPRRSRSLHQNTVIQDSLSIAHFQRHSAEMRFQQLAKFTISCRQDRPTTSRRINCGSGMPQHSKPSVDLVVSPMCASCQCPSEPMSTPVVALLATSIYRRGFSCFGNSNIDARYNPEMSDSFRDNPQHMKSSLTFQIALCSPSFLPLTTQKSTLTPFPSTIMNM
jgi:hypothetical protein